MNNETKQCGYITFLVTDESGDHYETTVTFDDMDEYLKALTAEECEKFRNLWGFKEIRIVKSEAWFGRE